MSTNKTFIVKIQASQYPYHIDFMTYNKDRTMQVSNPFDQKFFDEMMQGDEKAYFLVEQQKNGIKVIKRVDEQDW